jgi:glyoxylase-like metal-dependent hydrolase (beta-lactamase superfamily II)
MKIADSVHAFIWRSMAANNCNTYLIDGPTRVLIDPGHAAFFGHVEQGLREAGLEPGDLDLIVCTHGHPDHLEAVAALRSRSVLFALHEAEWQWIETAGRPMSASLGIDLERLAPDVFLAEGELTLGGMTLQVLHTPGHSPGSICLYLPGPKVLVTGDVVFSGGIGRTDLPGGSGERLKGSIERLMELEVDHLLPGHGEPVLGNEEVAVNFNQVAQTWFGYL